MTYLVHCSVRSVSQIRMVPSTEDVKTWANRWVLHGSSATVYIQVELGTFSLLLGCHMPWVT